LWKSYKGGDNHLELYLVMVVGPIFNMSALVILFVCLFVFVDEELYQTIIDLN